MVKRNTELNEQAI